VRGEDGTLIAWGVVCGAYKAATSPVIAKLTIRTEETPRIAVSGHEMGQGMRTAILPTPAKTGSSAWMRCSNC
jgi:xanthine dehydrogenase YagR molybdenum-binding subunit